MGKSDDQGKDRLQHAYNLTLASVTGLVGCLTLLIIGSVPLTLVLMFMVVNSATKRMKIESPEKKAENNVEVHKRD
jgi:uncharacterized membrane protein